MPAERESAIELALSLFSKKAYNWISSREIAAARAELARLSRAERAVEQARGIVRAYVGGSFPCGTPPDLECGCLDRRARAWLAENEEEEHG